MVNSFSWEKLKDTEECEAYRTYILGHELAHIPKLGHDPKSKKFRKCVPHDKIDFLWLVKKCGPEMEKMPEIMTNAGKEEGEKTE